MTNFRNLVAVSATVAAVAIGQNVHSQDDLNDLLKDLESEPAAEAKAQVENAVKEASAAEEKVEEAVAEVKEEVAEAEPAAEPVAEEKAEEAVVETKPVQPAAATAFDPKDAELIAELKATAEIQRKAFDQQADREIEEARKSFADGEYLEAVKHYELARKYIYDRPAKRGLMKECDEGMAQGLYLAALEEEKTEGPQAIMNFEPEDVEALDMIIPKYVTSLIYGALMEAVASENGARMQAMDSATNNANEMIDKLSLLYNRARQSSITQELTEIIAGADAIS